MAYGWREHAARGLAGSGVARAARHLPQTTNRLVILAYHRIFDIGDEDVFPFDPELVSATPEDFAWQMSELKSWGTVLTFRELGECLDGIRPLPPRAVMVTFDDGHLDNYTHAFPILKAAGVPATLFVCTGYLGRSGTFWFDRVAQLLFRAPAGALQLSAVPFETRLFDVASRRAAAGTLLERLKRVPDLVRLRAMDELESRLGGGAPDGDARLSGCLTWDQVREMSDAGIEIGSHSVSHPILSQLDDAALVAELGDSRRAIREHTGREAVSVAYPVGGRHAFDERVISESRAAGYRFGISYISGVNPYSELELFALKRQQIERYTSRAYFQCMLAAPRLFA